MSHTLSPSVDKFRIHAANDSMAIADNPGHAHAWKEGQTLAFLIDFLSPEGNILHRVFYQNAASERNDDHDL